MAPQRTGRASATRVVLACLATLVLAPLTFPITGCTAVGYLIGSAITHPDPPHSLPAGSALYVKPGTLVVLATEDSTEVRGVFLGRAQDERPDYVRRYEAWRSGHAGAPALGGGVEIEMHNRKHQHGRFDGFTYRALRVISDRSGRAEQVSFESIHWMSADSTRRWSKDELARLDAAGELPSREALRVGIVEPFSWRGNPRPRGVRDTTLVPADRVSLVWIPNPRTARKVFTYLGATADAIVIVAAAAAGAYACSGSDFSLAEPAGTSLTPYAFDTWSGDYVRPDSAAAPATGTKEVERPAAPSAAAESMLRTTR